MGKSKKSRGPRAEDPEAGSPEAGEGAAERRPPEPLGRSVAAAVAAWLVPGAGHFLLGRRGRAAVFCLLILLSIVIGCGLEGKIYRIEAGHPLSILGTFGSMGMGLAYFLLRWGLDYRGALASPGFEYGTAFLLTAGLMNLLLILDIWDIARGWKE